MSLDERETVHPVDATALFFDELGTEPDDDALALPGHHHAVSAPKFFDSHAINRQ